MIALGPYRGRMLDDVHLDYAARGFAAGGDGGFRPRRVAAHS